jgi:predicted ATP-grasp superfamily ATP-dependent carboligase
MGASALCGYLHGLPGVILVEPAQDGPFWRCFDRALEDADAVWPMAPLAGGTLERLSRHVLRRKRVLLGSHPDALHVCASRQRTAQLLAAAGIAVLPCYLASQHLPATSGAWMVRPDEGAGWLDTHLFPNAAEPLAWIEAAACVRQFSRRCTTYILQPFIRGQSGSLSLLCCNGEARLLACNEVRIAIRGQQFHLLGVTINHFRDPLGAFERLGQSVAAALPGLWGHVNVEFVMAEQGAVVLGVGATPAFVVAGLQASLGCNPALLALDLLRHPLNARPWPAGIAVSVDAGDLADT